MEPNSNWSTCCTPEMRISTMMIWTPVRTSRKTDGISTLCRMIPQHPVRNHQVTAISTTVHAVLAFLMSPIGTQLKTVWAGTSQWMRKLDSNFKSQLQWDSIHSMTGAIRWCGCFQVHRKIPRRGPWRISRVQMDYIPLGRVWSMLSGLKTKKLNSMWRTRRYRLQSLGRWGGGQDWNLPTQNH